MTVELISCTPNMEWILDQVYSVYYSKSDTISPRSRILSAIEHGHMSGLEFAEFHFKVSDISRACSHQLVRHRIAEYAQRSQRYVDEEDFNYVVPPSIVISKNGLFFDVAMQSIKEKYAELISRGVPKEDARYILPNACCTEIHVKMNYRQLWHFCQLRLCSKAQWEIRFVAQDMKQRVTEVVPFLGDLLVPQCEVLIWCPENKGCGHKLPKKDVQQAVDILENPPY